MTETREKKVAQNLLRMRDQGCKISFLVKRSLPRYILLSFALVLVIGGCVIVPSLWPFGFFVSGMLVGASLRDIGWFRVIKRQWPFTVRVTDWEIVEEIARSKPEASQAE